MDQIKMLKAIWRTMHHRCESPKDKKYADYGGRGIYVCAEWSGIDGQANFIRWALEHGYQPGLQIDRRDNDGPYRPSNCEWRTPIQQAANTRHTRPICVALPINAWARIIGVDHAVLTTAERRGRDLPDYIRDRINDKYPANRGGAHHV